MLASVAAPILRDRALVIHDAFALALRYLARASGLHTINVRPFLIRRVIFHPLGAAQVRLPQSFPIIAIHPRLPMSRANQNLKLGEIHIRLPFRKMWLL